LNGSIVVLGASGGIGRVIVNRLISAGHHVVAVARNREGLDELARRAVAPEQLILLPASVADDAGAALLAQDLRAMRRPLAAMVCCVGGPIESGRLIERSASFLLRTLEENVVSHFVAAKHLLPVLAESRPEGLYLLLGSPAAECTWAGYGHLSVSAVALRMLIQVLREEAKDLPVAIQLLQVGTPVRTEHNTRCACADWISAEKVADEVVVLIERRSSTEAIVRIGSYVRTEKRQIPTNAEFL
jgi:short-subunit dehydrogenase